MKCERCGAEMNVPPSWGKRFCSKACRRNERYETCTCGKQYLTWDAKKAPKTCGNPTCSHRRTPSETTKDQIASKLSKIPRHGGVYTKICERCGKKFTTKSTKRRYCGCYKSTPPSIELCKAGARASQSSKRTSTDEKSFGRLLPPGFTPNDRTLLNGLEIDYLYENLAVEYNGPWHYRNFHDHYTATKQRDATKNAKLIEKGIQQYTVGWALTHKKPNAFFELHAKYINELFEDISPFKFIYDLNRFKTEYNTLCRSKGETGYICHSLVNWYHNYRWNQKTKTKGITAIEEWGQNRSTIIQNREKYASLTPVSLRRYFLLFDYTPALFPDLLAKKLAKKAKGKLVVDPFAGYGNRLLGVTAAGKQYLGYDINKWTINANQMIISDLELNANVILSDSSRINRIHADILITCPPYEDKDDYGVESDRDFYEMIYETFNRIKVNRGFIVIKPSLVDLEKIEKAIGHIVDRFDVSWGGLGRKSIHTVLVI